MTDVYVDEEIDLDEAGRLAYSAVVRRLRNDEAKPLGDTALSKFASFYVEMAERQRAKEEASRPKPEATVEQADDFISDLRRIHVNEGMPAGLLREIVGRYILLAEESLEVARAFEKELAADVPA